MSQWLYGVQKQFCVAPFLREKCFPCQQKLNAPDCALRDDARA
jgi:hypothetical protein